MPPKRKRIEPPTETTGTRPSPHRPSETSLAQHDRDGQDGANRRRNGNPGGRNTRGRNAERRDSMSAPNQPNNNHRGPVSPTTARPGSSASQAAPQPLSIRTPATPNLTPAPSSPVLNSHYIYSVLTSPRLAAWQQTGRQEVVQHGIASRDDEDAEEITTISQEFTRAVMEKRLSPLEAGACMKEILGPEPNGDGGDEASPVFDVHSLFVDSISMYIDTEDGAAKPRFHEFVLASEVSPTLLRHALDVPVLEQLGLLRSTFTRMGIRTSTNLLYRQSNYNLLREESEGFSKLITELYWTPHNLNQEQLTRAQVEAGFERIKGLIGTFDMDVGRVLDITLDVFASTMMRTFRYFTMFLRVSSWWPSSQIENYHPVYTGGLPRWALPGEPFVPSPEEQAEMDDARFQRDSEFWERAREAHLDAFFELGGRRATEADLEEFINSAPGSRAKTAAELKWIKATKTLPPSGNQTAAQLFGFKLRFYTSQARDKDEIIPANLFYLAAYLIKVGFFSLPDLYPHLWPEDDRMSDLKERRMHELEEKEKKDRQGLEPNALLKAGALPDDTAPVMNTRMREPIAAKPEAEAKDANAATGKEGLPEPKEALKVDLVQHLLLIGAIPEALFMLGRFPWLIDAYPEEIISPINRILLLSIDKVYQEARPKETNPVAALCLKRELAPDQSGVPKGSVRLVEREPVKALKWPHANGFNRGMPYEYYLKEWADNIPICHDVEDVFTLCSTFLNISGVNIGRSPILLKKLAVIGAKSLHQDTSQRNIDRWQDLLKRIIVPALNMANSNVDLVDAVWNLLKHYPAQVRYNIYAECYEGQISRLPAMTKAFKYARLDTLAILKRLSLQNISSSAKHLAKVALFAPGVVCKVALDQIEAYTNLIEAFVECAKYFTDLGYDVLVWSLMSSLGGKQRSRTQESSVLLTSKWLQALSKFSGKVFRRYNNMDSSPVIQYVHEQLARGNSTDLVILRELITSMGGIVSDIDFTDAQLSALSGGEELRRQTFINLGDKRFESTRSANRLMSALVQTKLAPRLLTNIAQYRQSAIYRLPENETHIKYLATLIDDSQQALVQYVELLRSNLSPEEFDALVPGVPVLMTQYGLDANLAFLIGRVSLAHYLTGPGAAGIKGRRLSSATPVEPCGDLEGDVSMDVKENNDGPTPVAQPPAAEDQMAIDSQDVKDTPADGPVTPAANGQKSDHFLEVLQPIIEAVQTVLPPSMWGLVSAELFVLFWSLQTSDLSIPASSYNAETVRISKEIDAIRRDRSDMSKAGQDKNKRRREELTQVATKLTVEVNHVKERVGKTKVMLLKSAPTWIPGNKDKMNLVSDVLIESCLIPRMLLSPGDVDFCHKMIRFLHDNQVANFKLTALYDRFFSVNRLRTLIFSCSIREAEFLGRFLKLSLGDLSKWHRNKETYEKEATKNGKHVGFATALDEEGKPTSVMEHDKFRDQLWTWHRNISVALKSCLQGTEWMQIRNAITVLKAVLDYFPAVDFMGRQFMQALQKIAEREAATKNESDDGQGHRVDLSVTAGTAASALKKQESKWVMVQAFRSNTTADASDDKKSTEAARPAQLRAGAPEFKPTSNLARSRPLGEDEDGEVKDGRAQGSASALADGQKDSEAARSSTAQKPGTIPQKADLARSSRPTTPAMRPATQSPAPNARRDQSRLSSLPQLPPGLPNRPDVPLPGHFRQDEFAQVRVPAEAGHTRDHRGEYRERRDPREPRETRDTREPRPADSTKTTARGRESFSTERRPTENVGDAPRTERDRPQRPEGPARWEPPTHEREVRTPRDRSSTGRAVEGGRLPRDVQADSKAMPPPAQPEPPGPSVNPERARLINADTSDNMINPARAALIGAEPRPTARPTREESRDRTSRHNSPPRRSERSESRTGESSRDERPSRSHRTEHPVPARDSRVDGTASVGHRGEREGERGHTDKARDLSVLQGPQAGARGEPDRSRNSHQDPNYGRLNALPPSADMPQGPPEAPRGRGRHVARPPPPVAQPGPRSEVRFPGAEPPPRGHSPDRHQPPTGPASSRPRRGPAGSGPSNTPVSTPPATGSPTTGIHPDRMRHMSGSSGPPPPPSQPLFPGTGQSSTGVHPDRLGHIGSGPPPMGPSQHGRALPPLQTTERQASTAQPGASRPPPGAMPLTPGSERSNSLGVPTGPSGTNDRSKSGGRRQLAGINNVLAGSDPVGRSNSLRGRSSRPSLAGSDAQVLTGASPVSTPVQERAEYMMDRGEAALPRGAPNGDERASRGDRERGRRHHEHSDRSTRPSRHGSRERSTGRESRSKEHREFRDREAGATGGGGSREGDNHSSRRSGRETASGSGRDPLSNAGGRGDLMGSGREGGREGRHRGEGPSGSSGGRHDEYARGSGGTRGGGSGGMGGTVREDHRSREPRGEDGGRGSSRKRRSEDGNYPGPVVDGHKRQRQR